MNKRLLHKDIQDFINRNIKTDPVKITLKKQFFPDVDNKELAEQIVSKRKSLKKLPTWYRTNNIYYPKRINIEQTSSEITATYKAGLVTGKNLIDLTGGFGVDVAAFAKKFESVIHCEIDQELSEIAKHNFEQLQLSNINCVQGDGIQYLKDNKTRFDWIYADPSRRDAQRQRVFLLKDSLPDIPSNLELLFSRTDNILLKLSPFYDIKAAVGELKFVSEIHVVAVENEVKELLFILKKNTTGYPKITTVELSKKEQTIFKEQTGSSSKISYSEPLAYLYEPNTAIMKAGLFNEVSHQLNIHKLHINSHLFTSNILINFPGRRFKILHVTRYDKKTIRKLLPDTKANISVRNFPETVAKIRKRTGIKDGGDFYLFFTTDLHEKHICIITKKV